MIHKRPVPSRVVLLASITLTLVLNQQVRSAQPHAIPPASVAGSEQAQERVTEELKRSGVAVSTASFGIQIFLISRPDKTVWERLASVPVRRLHLSGDWATDDDLQQLRRLSSLELLYLSAPQVDDDGVAMISRCPGLTTLTLRNVKLTDQGLAPLARLTGLESLEIIGSKQLTGAGLQYLKRLPLRELVLEGNGLKDAQLSHLADFRALGRLELDDGHVTDGAVPSLKDLSAHKKSFGLRLCDTQISNQGLALLRREVPGLRVVRKDVSTGLENLRKIGIALHRYHADHGCFPPPVLTGPDGRTQYSWRVAALPYLGPGEKVLFAQYRRNEPWDSEVNQRILAQMPDVYRAPSASAARHETSYFALTGPTTMFIGKEGVSISEVSDRVAMALMVVETKRAVPWTTPVDIAYDAQGPLPEFGGFHEGGFNGLMATGEALVHCAAENGRVSAVPALEIVLSGPETAVRRRPDGQTGSRFHAGRPVGQKTTLSTLIAGKVALLTFTACRCGACRLEAPVLTRLDKKYKDQGLVVLAVNAWDEPAELVQKYVKSEKLTHRFLLNGHQVESDRYHFFETPTSCWIDHKGRLVNLHFGFDPGDEVALARRAEELLAARKRDAR